MLIKYSPWCTPGTGKGKHGHAEERYLKQNASGENARKTAPNF